MKKKNDLYAFIKKKENKEVLIQCKVTKEFHSMVKDKLKKDQLTFQAMLEASMQRYLSEK